MSKRILKCPNCKGEVDITEYPPGMKFTCPNCQATLQVPRQQPVQGVKPNLVQGTGFNKIPAQIRQQPVRPPGAGSTGNKTASPSVRSKYAPTMKVERQQYVQPQFASQGRQNNNYNVEKQKKSFLPLYIGGILVLMVLGVIAGVLISGSGGDRKNGNNGNGTANAGNAGGNNDSTPGNDAKNVTPDEPKPPVEPPAPKPPEPPAPKPPEPPKPVDPPEPSDEPPDVEPPDPPEPPVRVVPQPLPPPINPNPVANPAINQELKDKVQKMFVSPHPKDATEEQNAKRRAEIVALGKEAFPVCADIIAGDDGYIAKECGKILIELLPAGDYRNMMQGTLTIPETAPKQTRADISQRMIRFYVGHGKDVIK